MKRRSVDKKPRMTRKKRYPLVKYRRRSAYQFYVSQRAEHNRTTKQPPRRPGDYAADWKLETDKSVWYKLAEEDHIKFKAEVEACGYTFVEPRSKQVKTGPPTKSAFILYAADHSRDVMRDRSLTYGEALVYLGNHWRTDLEPEVKERYRTKAIEGLENFAYDDTI